MKIFKYLFVLTLLNSCGENDSNVDKSKTQITQPKTKEVIHSTTSDIKKNHLYNDISLVIAGMNNPRGGNYGDISSSNAFKEYNNKIDKSYEKFKLNKLKNFEKWSELELEDRMENTENLFYPFSGPDIAYAYSMIPSANNYYLFGLEPVGDIPNLDGFKTNTLPALFSSINCAISDNLNLSFFITKNMKTDLSNQQIKGTIPVLLFFMSRMDLHIQNIAPVSISEEGNIEYDKEDKFHSGVEITFIRKGSKKINKVYYFSMDISNYNSETDINLRKLTESMNNVTTLVKSSSYCMHTDKYADIRELTLNCSDVIVQDDTGIPLNFFDSQQWRIDVYGSYVSPISVFSMHKQQDLKDLIKKSAKAIDFRFGYNYPSNILVGRKNEDHGHTD